MGTVIWRDRLRQRTDRSLSNMLGSELVGIVRVNGCDYDCDCPVGYRAWIGEAGLRLYLRFACEYEQYGCICTSVQL